MARCMRCRADWCSPTAITARATTPIPAVSRRRCSRPSSPSCAAASTSRARRRDAAASDPADAIRLGPDVLVRRVGARLREFLLEGEGESVIGHSSLSSISGVALAHDARLVALPVALLLGLALVGFALALGEAELELGKSSRVEIDRQRHQRDAVALDGAHQAVDLAPAQQELAQAARLMVEARRGVFREMRVDEIDVAVALGGVG